jgi:hypothetical protein
MALLLFCRRIISSAKKAKARGRSVIYTAADRERGIRNFEGVWSGLARRPGEGDRSLFCI